MTDEQNNQDSGYKKPPKHTRFKAGQSGNPKGRPRKNRSFEEELNRVFGKIRTIRQNGKTVKMSVREVILEQIAHGACNKDPQMIRLSLPFLKAMDNSIGFEVLDEDKEIMNQFKKKFNDDGSVKNGK